MSRTERFRPTRVALVAGAVAGALALAGCGAGQIAQTAEQQSAVSGASATAQHIEIRNAEIEYPVGGSQGPTAYAAGSSAPVTMTIANDDDLPDRLVSASSPAASSVQITGDTTVPPHGALIASTTPGGTPSSIGVPIAVTLQGLSQDVSPGLSYPLVLVFERAGSVTVDLPVGNADGSISGEGAPAGQPPATSSAAHGGGH